MSVTWRLTTGFTVTAGGGAPCDSTLLAKAINASIANEIVEKLKLSRPVIKISRLAPPFELPICPPVFNRNVLAVNVASFIQTLTKRLH
ncbi:MAG: hypothetical protein WCD83_16260 [Pseudolabrys sp.]